MANSTIHCSQEQRFQIILLKKELKEMLGFEPKDRELVDMFLKLYREKEKFILAEILDKVSKRLEEIAINETDYEKLQQEVEELRKENEELREKLKRAEIPDDPKEIFNLFIKSVLSKVPEERRSDVERSLRLLQFCIFDPTLNVDLLEHLGQHAEELVYYLKFGRKESDSDSELRGGVQLW